MAARKKAAAGAADTTAVSTDPATGQTAIVFDLPEYHGRKPVGMRTSLSGTGNRITQAHGIGERFVIVAEVKCGFAGHKEVDGQLNYVESHSVVDMFEVLDGKAASRLIATMRQAARAAADHGRRTPLEGAPGTDEADMGAVGFTDASGVVLTPSELADLRGDPVAALIGDTAQVVVVYDTSERALWPDDYPADTIRPSVGDSTDERGTVVEVLDAVTAEPVDDFAADDDVVVTTDDAGAPASATEDQGPIIPEDELPTTADFTFVDRPTDLIRDDLEDITDGTHLRRILNAEKQGRGRALKPRKGALEVIQARIDLVGSSVRLRLAK